MRIERYAYDRAGRLVREGNRTYRYGYLDKVLSVTDGKRSYRYAYHVDGQLARADYGEDGRAGVGEGGRAGSPLPAGSEAFLWDGLALVRRGDESFVNEPHVGDAPKKLRFGGKPRAKRSARRARKGPRGNPVVSSRGATYFNDALGTTVGVREGRGASRKKSDRRYTAAALTAFGEPVPVAATSHNSNIRQFDHSIISSPFFTGKPEVEGLGRAFLYRNYRADLAKWQTADPFGYPDGWNQLAYCGNEVLGTIDLYGGAKVGDVRPAPGYESLPDELLKFTMAGFVPTYELVGFDTKPGEVHEIFIEGSSYIKRDTGTYIEYWGKFKDVQDIESWGLYDCIVTIQKSTVLSDMARYSGTIGEIGGWLGVFLKTNPWYDASMAVASAIGKLESSMKTSTSVKLGQVYRLDKIDTVTIKGPYDKFMYRRYRQEIYE